MYIILSLVIGIMTVFVFCVGIFCTVGNLHSASAANLATLQSYRPLLSDYGPPSLGFSQVNMVTLFRLWTFCVCTEQG